MIKVQYQDGSIQAFEWEDAEAKHAFWHTSSHLMAEALQELYPGIQFGIGPAIENGFYYIAPNMEWKPEADGVLAQGVQTFEPTTNEELQLTIDTLLGGESDIENGYD